jgi:hypothetical protein
MRTPSRSWRSLKRLKSSSAPRSPARQAAQTHPSYRRRQQPRATVVQPASSPLRPPAQRAQVRNGLPHHESRARAPDRSIRASRPLKKSPQSPLVGRWLGGHHLDSYRSRQCSEEAGGGSVPGAPKEPGGPALGRASARQRWYPARHWYSACWTHARWAC